MDDLLFAGKDAIIAQVDPERKRLVAGRQPKAQPRRKAGAKT
jgi:hypothetical protein